MNHEMISLSNIMYLPSPFLCFLHISAEVNILKYRSPGITPLFKIYQLILAYVIKIQALQHRAEVFSQWCSHCSSPSSILFFFFFATEKQFSFNIDLLKVLNYQPVSGWILQGVYSSFFFFFLKYN